MAMASFDYLIISVPAVLCHEIGHLVMARLSGIRVKRVGISWTGPYIVREQGTPFASFCTALAGPLLNLLLAVACWRFSPAFGLVNLVLGAYNLLPFIRGLDGYNAMMAFRKLIGSGQPV